MYRHGHHLNKPQIELCGTYLSIRIRLQ
jgi:hypothetical protein